MSLTIARAYKLKFHVFDFSDEKIILSEEPNIWINYSANYISVSRHSYDVPIILSVEIKIFVQFHREIIYIRCLILSHKHIHIHTHTKKRPKHTNTYVQAHLLNYIAEHVHFYGRFSQTFDIKLYMI